MCLDNALILGRRESLFLSIESLNKPGESQTLSERVIVAVELDRRVVQCPAVAVNRPLQTMFTFDES